jgi:UDP-N-acetyl-2-amino-2-deoxyglucuronate dehydrogenase
MVLMKASNDMKFAIIGCGRIAERHAEQIERVGELIAVCDVVPEKADALAGKYQAKAYYDISSLIADEASIDIAAVCTPNGLHAEHSIACLEAGMHVLCEKPMALNVADCQRMISAASRSQRLLSVVKQNRFNPPVIAVKKLLDRNGLGRILSVQVNCFWNRDDAYYRDSTWKGTLAMDGGILFTQFSHFIDLVYWLMGDITTVQGYSANLSHRGSIEFEDTGFAAWEFANGAIGSISYTVNSYRRNMEGSITFFGEYGTVKIGGEYLNKLEYQCMAGAAINDFPGGKGPNDYGTYTGSMSNHDKVYDNIVEAVGNKAPLTTNAADALKTVDIIRKIYAFSVTPSKQATNT